MSSSTVVGYRLAQDTIETRQRFEILSQIEKNFLKTFAPESVTMNENPHLGLKAREKGDKK